MSLQSGVEELMNIIFGSEISAWERSQEWIQPRSKGKHDERNRGNGGNHGEGEERRQLGRG